MILAETYKTNFTMKKISFALVLAVGFLGSCQKETTANAKSEPIETASAKDLEINL